MITVSVALLLTAGPVPFYQISVINIIEKEKSSPFKQTGIISHWSGYYSVTVTTPLTRDTGYWAGQISFISLLSTALTPCSNIELRHTGSVPQIGGL